ncbi:hypothetical protein BOX15_Mlig000026g1, partial [Macrostomum lignano]
NSMSATGSSDELCAQHGDQPFSNCWRFHAENPEDCCDDLTPGPSPSGGEDRSRSVSPYLPASGPDQRIDGAADQPPPKKKSRGKQKIKIEFIQDKNRRFTTFSKRKTGLMKKAYELASLTGAHVLLLVASETGHVYTYTTEKLNNMVQSNNGKALIQACLSSEKSLDGGGSGGGMMPSPGEAASPVGAGSGAPAAAMPAEPPPPPPAQLPFQQQDQASVSPVQHHQQQQQHLQHHMQPPPPPPQHPLAQQQQQAQPSVPQHHQQHHHHHQQLHHQHLHHHQQPEQHPQRQPPQQHQQQSSEFPMPVVSVSSVTTVKPEIPLPLLSHQGLSDLLSPGGRAAAAAAAAAGSSLSDRKSHIPASLDLSNLSNLAMAAGSAATPTSATFSPAPGSAPILQIPQSAFTSTEFNLDSPNLFSLGYVPVRGPDSVIFLPISVNSIPNHQDAAPNSLAADRNA